jgi:Phosphoadenosine phosphosulfate reductase family
MSIPNVFMFSGGRSSAMALHLFLPKMTENDLIVFNNTGREKEQTLEFVQKIADAWRVKINWIEYRNNINVGGGGYIHSYKMVDFNSASRNGEPFESLLRHKKNFLPNRVNRYCTEYLKIIPTRRFLQDIGIKDFNKILGIRYDEPERFHKNKDTAIMPLYHERITKEDVRRFWANQPFDLELRDYEGNCDLCFLKGKRKRLTILLENPQVADWWSYQEVVGGGTFDKGVSVAQLLNESKRPFLKTIDFLERGELSLFDNDIHCFCGD